MNSENNNKEISENVKNMKSIQDLGTISIDCKIEFVENSNEQEKVLLVFTINDKPRMVELISISELMEIFNVEDYDEYE